MAPPIRCCSILGTAVALLALAGLIWQWRRGNPLPFFLLIGLGLLLPLFDGRYDQVQHSRYLAPLLPFSSSASAPSSRRRPDACGA